MRQSLCTVVPFLVAAGASLTCAIRGPLPDRSLETLRVQLDQGAEVYRQHCHGCHDVTGAIGDQLSARVLASYYTARSLYDYIDLAMPQNEPGSLSEEEYWAVTAHLIVERRLAVLEKPLDPSFGDSLLISVGND